MRLHHARRSASAVLAAVALLCVLASCGTSSAPTQTSPPEASAAPTSAAPTTAAPTTACADVAALKSSLQALTKVQPAEDGLMALTTAIAAVKTNLDKAAASASPALQPSVQQVKTAFAELQTAASGRNRRQSQTEGPCHSRGAEAGRHGNGGVVLDADPELPRELTPTPARGQEG